MVDPWASSTYSCSFLASCIRPPLRFLSSIPSKQSWRSTTQRVMPIRWSFYLHVLVQFDDELTLKSVCAEFLVVLASVSTLLASQSSVC
jgi:hypothetical protein